MISVLIVGPAREREDLADLERADPSVEVLLASGLEDTLEKLGRNRRIDAVLIVADGDPAQVVAAIREDNPAHPPIFVGARPGEGIRHTNALPAASPREMLNLLRERLEP